MKIFNILLLSILPTLAHAQAGCLDSANLVHLDAEWERSLLESDVPFIESVLAEDFIWIFDHAKSYDTKQSLLKRASDPSVGATGNPISRTSEDLKVIILGSTAVVTGYIYVDHGDNISKYNFMRTYVEIDGRCLLLANQTMKISETKK